MSFYFGLDLGQRVDPAAFVVVEEREAVSYFDPRLLANVEEGWHLVVRHAEAIPLGTPYGEIAARMKEVVGRPVFAPAKKRLAVDATGVGGPVVEMLKDARMPCTLIPVTITGGFGEHSDGGMWHVPKVDLIAGIQTLVERAELRIARRMKGVDALVRELVTMEVRVKAGRARTGAEAGRHDDLAMALALACWAARKGKARDRGGRLFW